MYEKINCYSINCKIKSLMNARYFCVLGVVISIACAPKIEEEQVLEADLIFSSRIPEKEWIRVSADSIDRVFVDDNIACIVSGKEKKGHFFLTLFNLGSGEKIGSYYPYGSEIGEVLLPFFTKSQHQLLMYDPVKKMAGIIDIPVILYSVDYHPMLFHTNIFSQEIIPFKKRLLFLNPNSFDGKAPRVIISDRNWNYVERHKYSFDASNVVDGSLQYNPSRKKIAFLADYIPVIEIMNENGDLIRRIHFPHSVCDFETVYHSNSNITEYLYPYRSSPTFPDYSFCGSDSNEDYIACIYWREDWTYVILILDWEGHIIDGFNPVNKVIQISISSDGKRVFCWESEENNSVLREYAILQ